LINEKMEPNGNIKKRILQGSLGVSIIALASIISPILTGHDTRLTSLEKKQEYISVKVKTMESIPGKLDRLEEEIKNLEKLLILCNKDNPDLIKYLELGK